MQSRGTMLKQLATVLSVIAVIASLWLILSVGVGESYNAAFHPQNVNATTNATFGAGEAVPIVGTLDQIMVIGAFATAIGPAGLGLYAAGRNDPEILRSVQKYMPWIIGVVGIIGFTDLMSETLQGDRVWDTFTAAQNAYALFISSAAAAGILNFFGLNR